MRRIVRGKSYPNLVATLLVVALAGCGGTDARKTVQNAVAQRHRGSSQVRCVGAGKYRGDHLFRCVVDVETGVHEMRPSASCYVYTHGRVQDVTRDVGHC